MYVLISRVQCGPITLLILFHLTPEYMSIRLGVNY